MPSTPASPGLPAPRGASKSWRIGVGLLLTLVGVAVLSLLLPTAPGALGRVLPIAGAGIVALWVGGILMGIGSRT